MVSEFVHFVRWTEATLATDGDARIHLCVTGRTAFGNTLRDLVDARAAECRPIEITSLELHECVTASEKPFTAASLQEREEALLLARSAALPILTIGEAAGGAHRGGVDFTSDGNRDRLQVSRAATRAHRLGISSHVLEISELIGELNG